jgi:hypothetical protein
MGSDPFPFPFLSIAVLRNPQLRLLDPRCQRFFHSLLLQPMLHQRELIGRRIELGTYHGVAFGDVTTWYCHPPSLRSRADGRARHRRPPGARQPAPRQNSTQVQGGLNLTILAGFRPRGKRPPRHWTTWTLDNAGPLWITLDRGVPGRVVVSPAKPARPRPGPCPPRPRPDLSRFVQFYPRPQSTLLSSRARTYQPAWFAGRQGRGAPWQTSSLLDMREVL